MIAIKFSEEYDNLLFSVNRIPQNKFILIAETYCYQLSAVFATVGIDINAVKYLA